MKMEAGLRPGEASRKAYACKLVRQLTKDLARGTVVYADNWFTSPLLIKKLLDSGVYYVGTVRSDRTGYPNDKLKLTAAEQEPGVVKAMWNERTKMRAFKYYDKNEVSLMSSIYGAGPSANRRKKTRKSRRTGGHHGYVEVDFVVPEVVEM